MRRTASSSQIAVALFLVVGIAIGAGLVFGTLYATGSISPRTVISVSTQLSIVTQSVTATETTTLTTTVTTASSESTVSTAVVTVNAVALVHGATPSGTLVAFNSGNANVNVNSVTLTYGGQTCQAAITGSPIVVTAGLAPGVTLTVTAGSCATASVSGQAFTASLALSNGGQVPFSGTFS